MTDLKKKAHQALPYLRKWVNDLLILTDEVVSKIQCSEDDPFGFMAMCFLSKQRDHMISILALGENQDVVLISKSMIEGLCQLLWAVQDSDNRALRWRTFAWIHDWRVMRRKIAAGEPVDAERRANIEKALQEFGDQFLKRPARAARDRGAPLPDNPYHDNWTGHRIKQIFNWTGGDKLYQKLYKPFSDWQHWSPGGIGAAIKYQKNRVVYSSAFVTDLATVLATGFQCLLQTLEVVDKHLKPGMTSKIDKLRDRYIAWGEEKGENEN